MLNALIDFIHRLRDAAIPISMVEAVDATEALRHVDLGSRAELRAALKTVLVKRAEHAASFAALFDVYFAARRADAPRSGGGPPDVADPTAADDLLQALHDALRRNDEGALRAMATRVVQHFAGIDAQRAGSQQYYLYRVLRQLDLSNLLQRLIHEAGRSPGVTTPLTAAPRPGIATRWPSL